MNLIDLVMGTLFGIIIVAIGLGLGIANNEWTAHTYQEQTGLETEYRWLSNIYIKCNDVWFTKKEVESLYRSGRSCE